MAATSPHSERSTRKCPGIPATICRRYGYPAPYRGPNSDLKARIERLETALASAALPDPGDSRPPWADGLPRCPICHHWHRSTQECCTICGFLTIRPRERGR